MSFTLLCTSRNPLTTKKRVANKLLYCKGSYATTLQYNTPVLKKPEKKTNALIGRLVTETPPKGVLGK